MPRILHIGKFYPPFAGGMENFLADLIPAQLQVGDEIAALVHDHQWAWKRSFSKVEPELRQSFKLYRVPCYGRLLYAPVSPQFGFWLNRVIQNFKPEILHFHLPNTSAFFALLLPSARRIPWVLHWHSDVISSLDHRLSLAYTVYRPVEQAMLAHAQAIIATSEPYLASSSALKAWQHKAQVIPLGLNAARLPEPNSAAQTWAASQWQGLGVKILHIGRLTYYKGQTILLKALAQLDDAQTLIVGTGELHAQLAQQIQQLKLEQRVRLLGYCNAEQITGLLASCDIFCLPSLERTEAFGMVLLEAMRYAKPIVTTQVTGSGMTWVVQTEKTGLLVPPQQVLPLVAALAQLRDDPQLRTNLGAAGQQRFYQFFDIVPIAEHMHALYKQLITVKKPPTP